MLSGHCCGVIIAGVVDVLVGSGVGVTQAIVPVNALTGTIGWVVNNGCFSVKIYLYDAIPLQGFSELVLMCSSSFPLLNHLLDLLLNHQPNVHFYDIHPLLDLH